MCLCSCWPVTDAFSHFKTALAEVPEPLGNHYEATRRNRPLLLKWLIDRGANVDHQDRNGYCALHYVAQEKSAKITEMLLNAGASTELRDVYGNTPLWTAAFNARGDLSVVRLLAEHGASFDNTNNAGKSIREMAMLFFPDELPALTQKAKYPSGEREPPITWVLKSSFFWLRPRYRRRSLTHTHEGHRVDC